MSARMTYVLGLLLLLLSDSKLQLASSYETREKAAFYHGFPEELEEYFTGSEHENEVKRQPPTGSCTCTCETKPLVSSRKNFPETAALMRTAVKPDMTSAAKVKEPVSTRFYQSDSATSHQHDINDDPRSKIVKADPWEYSHMLSGNHDSSIYGSDSNEREESSMKEEISPAEDSEEVESTNENWGHESRFPWKKLPNRICFRAQCKEDKDCCMRYNLCDKSAKVCTDCWHGSNCNSEADCCQRFPYCQRSRSGIGKCVDVLKKAKEDGTK